MSRSPLPPRTARLSSAVALSTVDRSQDEKLYQPRIHSRWIRELHRIKVDTGSPMTVLVDRAVAEFVARYRAESQSEVTAKEEPCPPLSWNL
ncbi:MAG: hypothetical protein ACYC5M_12710 [Anaerolineae bacterium]